MLSFSIRGCLMLLTLFVITEQEKNLENSVLSMAWNNINSWQNSINHHIKQAVCNLQQKCT